jgi:hypothetical protein
MRSKKSAIKIIWHSRFTRRASHTDHGFPRTLTK